VGGGFIAYTFSEENSVYPRTPIRRSKKVTMTVWAGLVALIGAFAACSGSTTTSTSDAGSDASATEFRLFPDVLYSGFGGTDRIYKAPVLSLNCSGTVTWKVADSSIAALDSQEGLNATFKMLKAGNTTITATCGTKTASAALEVTTYTAAQITAGQAYWTGKCDVCHTDGPEGLDDTPTQLDADTDQQIINTFTKGVDPEDRPLASPNHKFTTTTTESQGLVAFMRSREPMGYPEPDHGL
jgi:hypothetical protein